MMAGKEEVIWGAGGKSDVEKRKTKSSVAGLVSGRGAIRNRGKHCGDTVKKGRECVYSAH